MKKSIILLFGIIFIYPLQSQIVESDLFSDKDRVENVIDTMYMDSFNFNDTIFLSNAADLYSVKLNTTLEKKYYEWLKRRVYDVWPYVYQAVLEYREVTNVVGYMDKKKDKKKYIRLRQKELAAKFENDLKNMTTSRGQILTKLIFKETNKTVYDIIKELKGGFRAFLYNSASGVYMIDLKQTFDPKNNREDLYIEMILQKGLADGSLQ